ncbi:outer membrane beta-barrel protein [Helicobacter cetorum]|uniref:outer membrane beta-barrel protein n=1 Tax=Helicobacter cetorum TaxID=138563 RepID=UPI0013159F69|nr:outer membrane beta-barrel protein [Helicobacter cetorum]
MLALNNVHATLVDYSPFLKGSLDGYFTSFGMEVGGGPQILEEDAPNPYNNTSSDNINNNNQALQLKNQDYNNTIHLLEYNQQQTQKELQSYAKALSELIPNIDQKEQQILLTRIQESLKTSNPKGYSLKNSIKAYQAYLNQALENYEKQNQSLITQAQKTLDSYQQELEQSHIENIIALQKSLTIYNTIKEKMLIISHDLKTSYHQPPISFNPNKISSMDYAEVHKAIIELNNTIKAMQTSFQQGIEKLKEKNKTLQNEYGIELAQLNLEASTLKQQVLQGVVKISENFAKDFHNQWEQYIVGSAFGKNLNNIQFINNGRSCALLNLFGESSKGGTCGTFNPPKPTWNKTLGLSIEQVWNTLFNIGQLGTEVIIQAPNVVGGGSGTDGKPNTTYEKELHDAFENINSQGLGNSNFNGNFTNSLLYELMKVALQHNAFSAFDSLLNAYTQKMIPYMLNVFSNPNDPFWAMGVKTPELTQYCQGKSGEIPVPYPSGGYQASFCEYNSWSNSYYLGALYFSQKEVHDISKKLQAQGELILQSVISNQSDAPASQSLSSLITAINALNQKGAPSYAIPTLNPINLSNATPYPPPPPPPLPPPPPTINTQATPLPTLIKPQNFNANQAVTLLALKSVSRPIASFSPQSIRANSYSLGLQTKLGYQKFISPFLGFSSYAEFGYRYDYAGRFSNINNSFSSLNHYRFGIGENIIINLFNKVFLHEKHSIIRACGIFSGLLGVANIYTLGFSNHNNVLNDFNLNFTFGLRIRHDSSLWTLGVQIPLVSQTLHISSSNKTTEIIDNYTSSNIFLTFSHFLKKH